jgi:excisionase family DNA binding protein
VSRHFTPETLTAGCSEATAPDTDRRSPAFAETTAAFGVDALGIRLFSVDELAEALGQDRRWVYRQTEERGLPALKLGRSLVFQLPAVLAWLEAHRVGDWGDGR